MACITRSGAAALMRLLWRLPADILHLHFGGDLTPPFVGAGAVLYAAARAQDRAHVPFRRISGVARRADGGARHVARIRSAPAGWIDRRERGNRRPVREVRRAPGTHPHDSSVCRAAAGPLAAAAGAAGVVPERAQSRASDGRPAGAGIRFADADRRDGRNSGAYPRAGLLIVGAGSLEESLRAQIASIPYRDHVLLYGDMPHAVTLRATLESDLLLRTTLYDGDSVSVREALYIGTPVIATDNGMRPEGVHLIPPSDPGRLRDAVCDVLIPRAVRRAPGGDGQENIRAVVQFYEELLA